MEELEGAVRSLSLERDLSGIMDSPLGRRGARRSLRSEPFFIGVAGGTASGESPDCLGDDEHGRMLGLQCWQVRLNGVPAVLAVCRSNRPDCHRTCRQDDG